MAETEKDPRSMHMSARRTSKEFQHARDADEARSVEEKRKARRDAQRDWQDQDDLNEYNKEWAQRGRLARLVAALGDPHTTLCALCGRRPMTLRSWVLLEWDLLPDKLFLVVAEAQTSGEACVCRGCYFSKVIKCNQE